MVPVRRVSLPLVTRPDGAAGDAVAAFRAFLGRVAPGFAISGSGEPPEQRPWLPAEPFGIVDRAGRSVALWRRGEVLGYGGAAASRATARAYADWTACGLPGLARLYLEVVRAGAAPPADSRTWTEPRGEAALIWRPRRGAEEWRRMFDD